MWACCLFNEPLQQDAVLDVMVFAGFVADGNGAIDDVKRLVSTHATFVLAVLTTETGGGTVFEVT